MDYAAIYGEVIDNLIPVLDYWQQNGQPLEWPVGWPEIMPRQAEEPTNQWRLPQELLLNIAHQAALPNEHDAAIDVSLLGVDRISDRAFREVMVKEFPMTEVIIHPCSHGGNCAARIKTEFEIVLGPANTNEALRRAHSESRLDLSIMTVNVCCGHAINVDSVLATGHETRQPLLAVFKVLDHAQNLLLCHLLQNYEGPFLTVTCQQQHKHAKKAFNAILEDIGNFVKGLNSIDFLNLGADIYWSPIIAGLKQKVKADVSTTARLTQLVESHLEKLTQLIGLGYPKCEILLIVEYFIAAFEESINHVVQPQTENHADRYLKLILLNYAYIILKYVSEDILCQSLTRDARTDGDRMLRHNSHMFFFRWSLRCISLAIEQYPPPQAGSTKQLAHLTLFLPAYKIRAQFSVAYARCVALSTGEKERQLCKTRTKAAVIRAALKTTFEDLDKVEAFLKIEGHRFAGLHLRSQFATREEDLFWLMNMRSHAHRIMDAVQIEARLGGQEKGCMQLLEAPVLADTGFVRELPWWNETWKVSFRDPLRRKEKGA